MNEDTPCRGDWLAYLDFLTSNEFRDVHDLEFCIVSFLNCKLFVYSNQYDDESM